MAIILTDTNFNEEVLKSTVPVLVDFWAPWCGPCRAVGPVIEELAGEYEGKAKIGKLNVDDNSDTSSKYGISSIPALKFFKQGKVVGELVGIQSKEKLQAELDKLIS